ncbi:hypothetical protein AX16_002809 [Volvariella volvacea WC 439]|nr:hypothetical protein AX16_002809 [Volvariella volvacea WC 439]
MSLLHFCRCARRAAGLQLYAARTYATSSPSTVGKSEQAKKPQSAAASSGTAIPRSSCPANTVIDGVNYLKDQPPVLAKPDEEYPEWLWTILEPKVWPDDGPGGKAERVRRRAENRQRIKDRNFMSTQ